MFPNNSEVLAFKTDTVWGFGARPDDSVAIEKIYEIKKRDNSKPLILMSNSFEHIEKYVKNIPNYAYEMIEKYLPGGLTLIFEKSEFCLDLITRGKDTVGIRIPNSLDFSQIIDKTDCKVLATTSCNLSGEAPVKDYIEATEKFSKYATIIKPIEDTQNENIPSTVVLCKKEGYQILRKGSTSVSIKSSKEIS